MSVSASFFDLLILLESFESVVASPRLCFRFVVFSADDFPRREVFTWLTATGPRDVLRGIVGT